VEAFLVIDGDKGWAALGPKVREVWIGRHGGLLHETSAKPEFLSARDHERWAAAGRELIFDPHTSALLEEQTVWLGGNSFDYPAGTVTGYATYVSTGVVDRLGERP
jgi:hypothetical protein